MIKKNSIFKFYELFIMIKLNKKIENDKIDKN